MIPTPFPNHPPRGCKPKAEAEEPNEKQGWKTADKLRKNNDATEYTHIGLGHLPLPA